MRRHAWRDNPAVRMGASLLLITSPAGLLTVVGLSIYGLVADGILPRPLLLIGGFFFSLTQFTVAMRLLSPTADEVLARDARPPILYFRPFHSDAARVLSSGGDGLETAVEQEARRIGPFIAIGNPQDRLPPLGAARFYVPAGADWKSQVERLLGQAQFVIMRVHAEVGEGVRWEVERIVATVPPANVLFLMPLPAEGHDASVPYRRFVEQVAGSFPKSLPPWRAHAPFLAFESDWEPRWLRSNLSVERGSAAYAAAGTLRRWIAAREVADPVLRGSS